MLTPQPFNLTGLREAWSLPRPDTWTRGGSDDRVRWQRDMARAIAQHDLATLDSLVADGAPLTGMVVRVHHDRHPLMEPGMSWMTQAVVRNDVPMMEHLFARGVPLDHAHFNDKKTMLHYALSSDALEAAQWLLNHGVGWEGVDSAALFVQDNLGGFDGAQVRCSPRCMNAWLGAWDRPWQNDDEPLTWANLAIVDNDASLLAKVVERAPVDRWNDAQREHLWITALWYDRDERLGDLLNWGLVPRWDIPQAYTLSPGEFGKVVARREEVNEETRAFQQNTPWWLLNEEVAAPWSWLVIRAGARRIAERWLSRPEELARMRETLAIEPLVLMQKASKNRAVQNLPPLEALSRQIDLSAVRDAHGNTPLHRWVGLCMESPALLTWAAQHYPQWGDVLNHAGQTAWAFAQEVGRPGSPNRKLPERLHHARTTWETAILNRALNDDPEVEKSVDARVRPRL